MMRWYATDKMKKKNYFLEKYCRKTKLDFFDSFLNVQIFSCFVPNRQIHNMIILNILSRCHEREGRPDSVDSRGVFDCSGEEPWREKLLNDRIYER